MLWCWSLFGWLVPTLLLLPPKPLGRAAQQGEHDPGPAARLASHLEEWLRGLLPSSHLQQQQQEWWLAGIASWALLWVAALLGLWAACCLVAPLLVPAVP